MAKALTLFLYTPPYSFQNTYFVLRLAQAALDKGLQVSLFASGDGVHNFTWGQRASGAPNAEAGFVPLMEGGLRVDLCGTCLAFRGIKRDQIMQGAEPSSLDNLFQLIKDSDTILSLGF